jgi:hypothetical protein
MYRKSSAALLTALVAMSTAATAFIATAPASAASPCVGTWDIVVGGLNNNDSQGFLNADQRVGYNSYDTRSGVNEINRLMRDHARACPGDRQHLVAYSGGAAAANVWARENGKDFHGKASVVLLGDPKRVAGPGGPGFAATDMSWVPTLGGANNDFGGLPTLEVCNGTINGGDHICQSNASWDGYANRGAHVYDLDVNHYPFNANGQIYR